MPLPSHLDGDGCAWRVSAEAPNADKEMQTRKKRDTGTMEGEDFIGFSREWTGHCPAKGRRNYKSALNSFIRFLGKETLAVSDMTPLLLYEYMDYLKKKEEERDKKLHQSGKRVPSHRAASLYMGSLRHLFREMRLMHEVSWDGRPFPWRAPFAMVRMPRQEAARKRALSPDVIRRIYGLPYEETHAGKWLENRHDLAKDCFLLSFCLIGMNSADLYGCTEYMDGSIAYHRAKTRDRRGDGARMVVQVPAVVEGIFRRRMDVTGERVFDFHRHYSTASSFNRAINLGLKRIGSILGIEDLEYYAA